MLSENPGPADPRRHLHYILLPMRRVGECDRCINTWKHPWCCSDLSPIDIESMPIKEEVEEFLNFRGEGDVTIVDHKLQITLGLPPCPQLLPDRGCKVYDRRPKVCMEFPKDFSQVWTTIDGKLVKICSYDWDLDRNSEAVIDFTALIRVMNYE